MIQGRIDAVYGRQSVDKQDSISIESQIEFCKYELKGGNYREYTDKGYSGKNTDRPQFQALVKDIEQGLISRVIVYKLDRISRSIIDFANIMELFGRYNVEFVSSTEKFDTSTPIGRAMLNICIVFAQLERETIQKRVKDAYHSRRQKGFSMGGKAPYGFKLEPIVMNGINTKQLVAIPEEVERVKLMFEMYAKPGTSYGDIIRHFNTQGIKGKELLPTALAYILHNPVYVKADLEIYEFFKSQGTEIVNDAADFAGINGCYLFKGRDATETIVATLKGQQLVVAPHEGIVSSETWLEVRKKRQNNKPFSTEYKASTTWLASKIKCGRCGGALMGKATQQVNFYFYCRKRMDTKTSCEGCGRLQVQEVEKLVYGKMQEKMSEFKTLTGGDPMKANPKLTAYNIELLQVEAEIEKLLDTLTGANPTLLSYANTKIEELDAKRQGLMTAIADISVKTVSPERLGRISNHLEDWDNASFEDRRLVLDGLVSKITATSEFVQIDWKI
jgi:DNA invertase Pin-like site-specific DNA recombinase